MPCYAGLDCSKETTSICVLGADGSIILEGTVASSPPAIATFLRRTRQRYVRVGLESWTMAPWLYDGLLASRLPAICIDALHAHRYLKVRRNKTDRNDARGIAEMMRVGLYRAVHVKSESTRELQALFGLRRTLVGKQLALERTVGALLLQWGLKMPRGRRRAFEQMATALASENATLKEVVGKLLELRATITTEVAVAGRHLEHFAQKDPICSRLMTAPGVGPMTALAYRIAIEDPGRFARSRDVAAHLGLVPRVRQSGGVARYGRTTRRGDLDARTHLFIAAQIALRSGGRSNWLRTWGETVAARRGRSKAIVAVARRLAVVLHRMWIDGSEFRWDAPPSATYMANAWIALPNTNPKNPRAPEIATPFVKMGVGNSDHAGLGRTGMAQNRAAGKAVGDDPARGPAHSTE